MSRRSFESTRFRNCLPVLAIGVAVVVPAGSIDGQGRDFSEVKVEARHVSGPIHMLTGAGGNIGVSSGADGVLIVDDQFAPLAAKIRAAIDGLEGGSDLAFVLNTHWHGDHTGGNVEFGTEAPIIAHANVRRRLLDPPARNGQAAPSAPDEALPVVTFGDSLSIHFNDEEIRVIHFPHGHTDGDAVIFFTGSNVVHMGDDFFAGRFPFVDIASGGSVRGLLSGIEQVLEQVPADAAIIPGHGPLSTVDDLRLYRRMLSETIAMVEEQIEDGHDLAEIQSQGVSDEWSSWGEGFISTDRWLATIHQSLTAGNG